MLREGAALLMASTPTPCLLALGSSLALGANLCFPTEPDTRWFHKRERVYINVITGTILRWSKQHILSNRSPSATSFQEQLQQKTFRDSIAQEPLLRENH